MAINYTLTPSPWQTFFYTSGAPVASGQLYTYLAGTTTPATTYLNSSGTPNTNPIILDAAGRAVIYLAGGSYRFDLYDSVANGGALIKTEDNISAVPVSASQPSVAGVAGTTIVAGQAVYLSDGSGGLTAGRWYLAQANNAYSSTIPEVGFAQADTTAGNPIAVIQTGQVLSPLTVTTGLGYYIDSFSAGALTTTAPSLARYMGQADTASSLIVGNGSSAPYFTVNSTAVGTQNDFVLGSNNLNAVVNLRMNNASPVTITGIVAGFPGQRLIIQAYNAQVDLVFNSGLSLAQNRMLNYATSANTSLAASSGGSVASAEYVYDPAGAWRLVHHEQGAWISTAFSAGNFTGSGAMTWTMSGGNVDIAYRLSGKTLVVNLVTALTTVGGTPDVRLNVAPAAFGGYALSSGINAIASLVDNGSPVARLVSVFSPSVLAISKANGASFSAAAATTTIQGQIVLQVT